MELPGDKGTKIHPYSQQQFRFLRSQDACKKTLAKIKSPSGPDQEKIVEAGWTDAKTCHHIRSTTKEKGLPVTFGAYCYWGDPAKSSYILIKGTVLDIFFKFWDFIRSLTLVPMLRTAPWGS